MRNNLLSLLKLCSCVLLLFSHSIFAQDLDSEAIIKFRGGVMKAQGGLMAAMAQIVRGKVAYEDRLLIHAKALQGIIEDIPELFPEGSDFGETEAKEEIWDKWDEFKKSAERSTKAANNFVTAVQGGDDKAIGEGFKKLADACKGCHKKFRKEEH